MLLACGCDTKGFLDPTEMLRTGKDTLLLPIVSQVDPAIEEMDQQWTRATEPTAEDQKRLSGDYRIAPDDLLAITLSDINGPNTETVKQVRVTESGNISLPYLDSPVHGAGLTEIQLEQAIVKAYRDANLVLHANVSVTVVEARGRAFKIFGAVGAPGEYAVLDPDFRVLDAIVLARNVASPFVDYIYIIRRVGGEPSATQPTYMPTIPATGPTSVPSTNPSPEELAPPRVQANSPADLMSSAAPNVPAAHPAAAHDSAANSASQARPQHVILAADAVSPPGSFDGFRDPGPEQNVRVIRIPYQALREGRLGYNIPVHPRDTIYVAEPQTGFYYVGGHVLRPGTYGLGGAKVTLKDAIVSASMFDGLAIPQRTDIIRRIRPDKEIFVRVDLEKVFAGEQPDVYLKPDDTILVGTNAIAPFLAAIRGSFRITYGFGFLYDRNYAYPVTTAGAAL